MKQCQNTRLMSELMTQRSLRRIICIFFIICAASLFLTITALLSSCTVGGESGTTGPQTQAKIPPYPKRSGIVHG